MIPESKNSRMSRTRNQIKNRAHICKQKNIYSVEIYEIDPYFYEHYKEKIQANKNGREYMLFRIDVYFIEYLLAVEVDEKGHTDRDLTLRRKDKKHQKKNLVVNLSELIRLKKAMMQTMKLVEYEHLSVNLKTNNQKS